MSQHRQPLRPLQDRQRTSKPSPLSNNGHTSSQLNSLDALGERRWRFFLSEIGKYSRLIINDHFSVILLVLFAFGAMYYQRLLEQLSMSTLGHHVFWIRLIVAGLFAGILDLGRVIWLTKYADKSFVYPLGDQWRSYWLKGMSRACVIPLLILFTVYLMMMPLLNVLGIFQAPWQGYVIPIILGGALLISHIQEWLQALTVKALTRWQRRGVQTVISASLFLLSAPWNLAIATAVMILIGLYTYMAWQASQGETLQFERVIDFEEHRERQFYQGISLFAQVPHKPASVHRLPWLDGWIRHLPGEDHRFAFHYKRQLWRHAAYRSIWMNVTFFIGMMLVLSPFAWMQVGWSGLAIVMTLSQLAPLMVDDYLNPFEALYAYEPSRVEGLRIAVGPILLLQLLVFGVLTKNIWSVLSAGVFTVTGLFVYLPWWYNKQDRSK